MADSKRIKIEPIFIQCETREQKYLNQWPDLLAPLDPHSHAVLKEGGHKAETSQVRENMLRVTGHFVSNLEYEM